MSADASPPGAPQQSRALVYIIVITFNGCHHLDLCFRSLRTTSYPNFQVVLIDNGSSDGSFDYTHANFPEVQILRNEANLGFAGGNNRGMEVALEKGAKYIVLLNDDTAIIDVDWLSEAVGVAERDPGIGMLGFNLLRSLPTADDRAARPATAARYHEVARLDGCALFIPANLLKYIGLFDEAYFAYAEEDDLEFRATRVGMKIVELDRRIYHFGGGTSKRFPARSSYLQMRNFIRYSIKNRSLIRTVARICRIFDVACNPCSISFDPIDETHTRMRGEYAFFRNLKLFCSAVIWNILHFVETLAARTRDREKEQRKP